MPELISTLWPRAMTLCSQPDPDGRTDLQDADRHPIDTNVNREFFVAWDSQHPVSPSVRNPTNVVIDPTTG
jgi:hypothetical protein